MKRMALKSKFGFTKINHNYTEEERQVTETKVLSEAHIWMPRPKQDTYINIKINIKDETEYWTWMKTTILGTGQLPLPRVPTATLKGFSMVYDQQKNIKHD